MGNVAGLISPAVIGAIRETTGSFTWALLYLAGAMLLGALIVLRSGLAQRGRATAGAKPI
jgi:MFS transporter, ACS family, tartrate transporter